MRITFAIACSALVSTIILAYADEGGGGNQSTRTFTINQASELDVSSLDSNFQYVTYLYPELQMQTSAYLTNAYNSQSNQSSEDQRYSGAFAYTPSKKWNYHIEYVGDTSHSLRPRSSLYDYYEANSQAENLNSALAYNFSDTLSDTLSMSTNHSKSFSSIPNRSPLRSEVSGKNIGTTLNYALTGTTNFNTGCTIGRTHTIYPPHSPEDPIPSNPSTPDLAGQEVNLDQLSISAGVSDSRKVLEHIDMGNSISHSESVGKDSHNTVNDNQGRSTTAQSSLTWSPMDKLRFPLTLNFNDSYYIYTNLALQRQIKERHIVPGTSTSELILLDFYNSHTQSYGGDLRFEWEPTGYARFNVTGHESANFSNYFDENHNPPPPEDPRVYQISNTQERSEVSNLSMVIGENINFNLAQTLGEQIATYPSRHNNDNNRLNDALTGAITYEFSPRLTANITTGMNDSYTNNYDVLTKDSRILGVNMDTSFTLKTTEGTKTNFGFSVSKDGSGQIDSRYPDWKYNPAYTESLNRAFTTSISHDYGVLSPSLASTLSQIISNRPTANVNNDQTLNWSIMPTLTIRPSEVFYTNLYASITGYKKKYPNNPNQTTESYAAEYYSLSFNYSPTQKISFDISAIWRDQRTRPRPTTPTGEKNAYLNTASSVSVQF